jgi:hypothetical protein
MRAHCARKRTVRMKSARWADFIRTDPGQSTT